MSRHGPHPSEPLSAAQPAPAGVAAPAHASAGKLDEQDRRVLNELQAEFPVNRWPYEVLAARLEMPAGEVLHRVEAMQRREQIRRIGAVFQARRLGYASSLLAARVPRERLDEVAAQVCRQEGVTYVYGRRHEYNLWFTLIAPSAEELDSMIRSLSRQAGIELHSLPVQAAYKGGTLLPMGDGPARPPAPAGAGKILELDGSQRRLVRLLQGALPTGPNPLNDLARQWGRPVEILIVHLRHWLTEGLIRRFAAVLAHDRVGYTANGLAAFDVPAGRVDPAGAALARHDEVSHCYCRATPPGWPYNLTAMVHGRSEEQVRLLGARAAGELRAIRYAVLFCTRWFKTASMRFFQEPA